MSADMQFTADNQQLLFEVSKARVRDVVTRLEGCADEIIVDMIMRHLARCESDEDADAPGLERLLSVIIGSERASGLSRALLPPPDEQRASDMRSRLPDFWPFTETVGSLPMDRASPIEPSGPFGLAARGVEVRRCVDRQAKGLGAFAMRFLSHGELVGLYRGERLTFSQFWLRHAAMRDGNGGLSGTQAVSAATLRDREWAAERIQRLAALTHGAPIGGANNGAKYVFKLPPWAHDEVDGEPVYCVDAEDPNRSSWCRYLNHAPCESPMCNCEARVDARGNIWFVVSAPSGVVAGTELCFDYQAYIDEEAPSSQVAPS